MKSLLLISFFAFCSFYALSQPKILVYHETNGFRHGSINAGITMFEDLGSENGDWLTDNSQDSNVFTDANLQQYELVVFLNTSGNDEMGSDGDLLSASEKLALENFISAGKGYIGIHAATDTYRDDSWPFYNELVGGILQTSPNHTSNNYNADMQIITDHPITDFLGNLGDVWNKDEEYYYWEQNGGQLSNDNNVLFEVEQTGNESYDAARPITWYKESISYDDDNNDATPEVSIFGFRSFYTALGHNSSDYNSNTNFRTLLKNAVLWALEDAVLPSKNLEFNQIIIVPNPVRDKLKIYPPSSTGYISTGYISAGIYNSLGQLILEDNLITLNEASGILEFDMQKWPSGLYFLNIIGGAITKRIKFLKY